MIFSVVFGVVGGAGGVVVGAGSGAGASVVVDGRSMLPLQGGAHRPRGAERAAASAAGKAGMGPGMPAPAAYFACPVCSAWVA